MAAVPSRMIELGTPMPDFSLPDVVSGETVTAERLRGRTAVIAFLCNHCPYVKHVLPGLVDLGRELADAGVAMVAISSNDAHAYPDDSPERMRKLAAELALPFAYLYDETQDVARAYEAACTPDFYVFDAAGKLAYRGQMDDSRPGNGKPVTGHDLRAAIQALQEGARPAEPQKPSIGCSLKWKTGQAPSWA